MLKRTVLVVDDSEADQFFSKRVLRKFDPAIEVLQAYDGRQALQILDGLAEPPALILLDINMPVMNGHEFLAEYSKRSPLAVVVVMLTSSANSSDRKKAEVFDCVEAYLTKMLSLESLTRLLPPLPEGNA